MIGIQIKTTPGSDPGDIADAVIRSFKSGGRVETINVAEIRRGDTCIPITIEMVAAATGFMEAMNQATHKLLSAYHAATKSQLGLTDALRGLTATTIDPRHATRAKTHRTNTRHRHQRQGRR